MSKELLVFSCRDCSSQFTAMGIRSHPVRFCPDCRKIHLRLHNQNNREYRAARHKRVYRLDKAPYEVVRHDDPDDAPFNKGARFSGKDLMTMVHQGYAEGLVVKRADRKGGGVFEVMGCEMREVRE